ncbi:hypothetical protein MMC07_004975 [Pseudocyphellaria aurata]|nr:hypothetical protein [Pseudocyphellaria aurata]
MLHELLLALSGHPSTLLYPPTDGVENDLFRDLLSPAETALLRSLAEELGERHKNIREWATSISSTHSSIVCRAVSTAIVSTHLESFQQRILEVERWILEENSNLVGAYNIVPLSGLVNAFDGWGRRLEWLWRLVQFIQPEVTGQGIWQAAGGQRTCTASRILERLRESTHTGYPDIEQIALHLTKIAEKAWLKQVSAWVLDGRLPSLGATDFFIVEENPGGNANGSSDTYGITSALVPAFVTPSTANSILFIGKSLNHIRNKRSRAVDGFSEPDLLSSHLAHLSSLGSPINTSCLSAAVSAIRVPLSKNALQKLLPQSKVLGLLRVLKDFFLLERGEFAVALIQAADERLASRPNRSAEKSNQKGPEGLDNVLVKEGEVCAILSRTWTSLSLWHSVEDDDVDEDLELAREVLRLSIKPHDSNTLAKSTSQLSDPTFDGFLLPTPTTLTLRVPSPLDLVLSSSNVETYSRIHAYLLSIRRGHLRLSQLFLLSVLRRDHPFPKAPQHLSHLNQMESLARMRQRAKRRAKTMRPIWAAVESAMFFLAELGEFLQGQVIKSSWEEFNRWLDPVQRISAHNTNHPVSLEPAAPKAEREAPTSNPPTRSPQDPETLSLGHSRYLMALTQQLLLTQSTFTAALHAFLLSSAHLCALTNRLAIVQHSLDLQTDTGVQDVFMTSYAAEEADLATELRTAATSVEAQVKSLVELLREIDRGGGRVGLGATEEQNETTNVDVVGASDEPDVFIPWKGWGVERLLLKLEWSRRGDGGW